MHIAIVCVFFRKVRRKQFTIISIIMENRLANNKQLPSILILQHT